MKLPEYRPMPQQWNNDDDSRAFGAVLGLLGLVALVVASLALLLLGLFR